MSGRLLPVLDTEFCGTERGYGRHRRARVPACDGCREAHAEYERVRTTGSATKRTPAPCGTDAAYHRHRRDREPQDQACLDAHAAAERERRSSTREAA